MTKTSLGLLRHGQTDWNLDMKLQGTVDIPLNDTGWQQARDAAKALSEQSWDIVLSSPLSRALDTATVISEVIGAQPPVVSQLLLERAFGIGEGMTYDQWHQNYANLDEIPGAESAQQMTERSELLLDFVEREFSGARVLAVTHGALIRFVVSNVSAGAYPPPGQRLQNASLHILNKDQTWQLEAWAPEPIG